MQSPHDIFINFHDAFLQVLAQFLMVLQFLPEYIDKLEVGLPEIEEVYFLSQLTYGLHTYYLLELVPKFILKCYYETI
jgi:hypothetical protein